MATILLVDDDPNILRPLRLLLEREGYRVLTASDGQAALAAAAVESPNLIVTDWMMPRLDGVGLCRQLRDDAATADIPVVMLSAASPHRRIAASSGGAAVGYPFAETHAYSATD